jgi:hypothetical protein
MLNPRDFDPDPERTQRIMKAMTQMAKIKLEELRPPDAKE